jgi:uncharacterized protein YodC (DUF2158 family)
MPDIALKGTAHWFQSGDKVRTVHGTSHMTVIVVIGDKVHCEWLVGTELQQHAFPASALRIVERFTPRK